MGTLRDVLRLDVRSLYLIRSGPKRSRVLDFIYSFGGKLEALGQGRHYRVMLFAPVTLWRLWARAPDTPAERLHRLYLRGLWDERGVVGRAGLIAGAVLLGGALHLVAGLWAWAIRGGGFRLFLAQRRVALQHNILGPWFYQYGFEDAALRARAGEYLHRFELKCGLYHEGNRRLGGHARNYLKDKQGFAELCSGAGLRVLHSVGAGPLPPRDLFLKPQSGRGGAGVMRLDAVDGGWRDVSGRVLDEAQVRALAGDALIQLRAVTHPAIADLSNGALTTTRILTIRDERGEPEAVAAVFRMAVGRNVLADNFHAGGIAANVDLGSGVLGQASDMGVRADVGWVDVHPDTGGRITGRVLPDWQAALELARAAHRLFPSRLVVGWDIGISQDGPVLVEGNGAPDTDIHQRMAKAPLGNARFGELLAFHLDPPPPRA